MPKLLLILLFFSSFLYASSLNRIMNQLGKEIESLLPYSYSPSKEDSPFKRKKLKKKLKSLQQYFSEAAPHFSHYPPATQVTYKTLTQHLDYAIQSMDTADELYLKKMLQATTNLCLNCHQQDHRRRSLFSDLGRATFPNDLSYAEFNFTTRNYSKALTYFQKAWTTSSKFQDLILQRQTYLYLHELKSPEQAIKNLEQKVPQLKQSFSKKQFQEQTQALRSLASIKEYGKELTNYTAFQNLIQKYFRLLEKKHHYALEEKDKILYNWLHSLISKNQQIFQTSEQKQTMLYWLAKSQEALEHSFFYSFSDLYLKECIYIKPGTTQASRCFKKYDENKRFSFTGTLQGEDLPADVQAELSALKALTQAHLLKK